MNYIKLRKNSLCLENVLALNIVKKFTTPFYCYSLKQLRSNFYEFNNAFKKIEPIICFSVKSNSNLTILKELKKIGIYKVTLFADAEVVKFYQRQGWVLEPKGTKCAFWYAN